MHAVAKVVRKEISLETVWLLVTMLWHITSEWINLLPFTKDFCGGGHIATEYKYKVAN